jgi:subtilisin family serine protease
VSGIIARLDPKAKIMALKAGDGHFIDLGAAASAIHYAVAHGARVINLSWAFLSSDASLEQAVAYAGAHNVLVVAAAGNFGTDNDLRPTYPASYLSSTLVSVAATCDGQTLASFSNFGKVSVSVAAPGCNITSTLPGGAYGALSGTSMAAPAVAGVAALLLEHRPATKAADLARDILGGAQPAPSLSEVLSSGSSLSAAGALAALANPDRIPPAAFTERSPSPSFATRKDPTYYYQSVGFSWTQSRDPDLAGYTVLVDGRPVAGVAPTATSVTAKIGPGAHTWSVVAYDRSGNATTAAR